MMKSDTKIANINIKKYPPLPEKYLSLYDAPNFNTGAVEMVFDILNTRPSIANGLRRMINYEIDILVLNIERKYFETDDEHIIFNNIRNRIKLLRIKQISNMTFYVDVKNNTDEIIDVYSSDIKEYEKSKEEMFTPCKVITHLYPGKYLKIENIKVITGNSETASTKHQIDGNIMYECLDLQKYIKVKETSVELDTNNLTEEKVQESVRDIVNTIRKIPSSMEVQQRNFRLTIRPQRYFHPTHIVKLAIKNIIDRLKDIHDILISNLNNDVFFLKKIILIKEKKNFYKYKLMHETNTMGNLISERVREDTGAFITFQHEHQEDPFVWVKVRTEKNPNVLLSPSLKNIIVEFEKMNKAF